MPLRQSKLITRKQLHALSGGKKDKDVRYRNPLKLGTPFNYVGGRAVAMAQGQVHHICIKEGMNVDPPESNQELFVMYRFAKKVGDDLQPDVKLLMEKGLRHPPIPIFWEPNDQSSRKPTAEGGKGVSYVGHWNVQSVIPEKKIIHGIERCAVLSFGFDRYDTSFSKIIELCHDKTCAQIETLSFDDITTRSTPEAAAEEEEYASLRSPERLRPVVSQPVAQVTPIASDNPFRSSQRFIRNKTRIDYQEYSDSSDGESPSTAIKPKLRPRKMSPRRPMLVPGSHEEDTESEDDRKPKARKRHSPSSAAVPKAKRKPSEQASPTAAAAPTATAVAADKGEESDDSSVVVMDVVCPPTYRYFQVIIDGDEDDNSRFVRLHVTPNEDTYTFQDLRQAIQNQLSCLPGERRSLESFQFTLGKLLVDPLQETWQVNEFIMVDSGADGSIGKPYQVTIKMVKPLATPST